MTAGSVLPWDTPSLGSAPLRLSVTNLHDRSENNDNSFQYIQSVFIIFTNIANCASQYPMCLESVYHSHIGMIIWIVKSG